MKIEYSLRRTAFAGFGAAALLVALEACSPKAAPAAVKPPVPVIVAGAETRRLPLRIDGVGNAEPISSIAVKSRLDGQVIQVGFHDGDVVRKGQLLFEIDARPARAQLVQAEANLARDEALVQRARQQDARYKDLVDKGFISPDAYQQYKTNLDTALAAAAADRAAIESSRLQVEYASIRAPIDGQVGKTLIAAGNLVKANDTVALVTINQVTPIYVSFAVPESRLDAIRAAQHAGPVAVEVRPGEGGGAAIGGRLAFVDNAVDATTGTVRLRALLDNRDGRLWPGEFVHAAVLLAADHDVVVVPASALQSGPAGAYLYAVEGDAGNRRVRLQPVEVERIDGELALIGKGLASGEQVVTDGQSRLVPAAAVTVKTGAAAQ